MDKALSRLLSFSLPPPSPSGLEDTDFDHQIRELVKVLSNIPAKSLIQPIDGQLLLEHVDPSLNAITYLYALCAQISTEKVKNVLSPSDRTWVSISNFVARFDPIQVRYVGHQWRLLVEDLLDLAEATSDNGEAQKILALVQAAMLRLDPGTSTLTSTHLTLVKVCLQKRAFEECGQILANEIYHIPAKADGSRYNPRPSAKNHTSLTFITASSGFSRELTYRDPIQYFLFGGMIYMAQRDWSRALFFLEMAMVSPVVGNTASMIQAEAYKKWLMIGILLNGKAPALPRTVSAHTAKLLASVSKPYIAIADAFKEAGPFKLKAEFRAGNEDQIWQSDGNFLLVQTVVDSHRVWQVLSFSKIYSSIPMETLAKLISEQEKPSNQESPSEIEDEIRDIIKMKKIHASTVRGKDGTVLLKFLSPDGKVPLSDLELAKRLRSAVGNVETLNIHVKDSQRRLELTRDYMNAAKKRRAKEDGPAGFEGITGGIDTSAMMDEDMLAEL